MCKHRRKFRSIRLQFLMSRTNWLCWILLMWNILMLDSRYVGQTFVVHFAKGDYTNDDSGDVLCLSPCQYSRPVKNLMFALYKYKKCMGNLHVRALNLEAMCSKVVSQNRNFMENTLKFCFQSKTSSLANLWTTWWKSLKLTLLF